METKTKKINPVYYKPMLLCKIDIVILRVFNLSKRVVWAALTEPENFKKWWGPKGFTAPSSKMEAMVGGKYLNCMRGLMEKNTGQQG